MPTAAESAQGFHLRPSGALPFWLCCHCRPGISFCCYEIRTKNNSPLGATRFVHNNGVFSPRKPCEPNYDVYKWGSPTLKM
jgi:hypothetical protein